MMIQEKTARKKLKNDEYRAPVVFGLLVLRKKEKNFVS